MSTPGNAVVIGAGGLVGSAVALRLGRDDWDVTATVRTPVGDADARRIPGSRVVRLADACDPDLVGAVLGSRRVDVVIACMSTNPIDGAHAARAYGDGNVTSVAVVLDACVRAGIGRAIIFGSGFEYAPSDAPSDERAPLGPTTLYGATKAAGTSVAAFMRGTLGLDVCVVRPFSVYGPRERPGRFVPGVIGSALAGLPIEMSDGLQRRDYLYVDDLADAVARLASHPGRLPEALNLCGAERHTLLELVSLVVREAASASPVRAGARPRNAGDRSVFLGDASLAREVLDWTPAHTLASGVARTVAWYAGLVDATAAVRPA